MKRSVRRLTPGLSVVVCWCIMLLAAASTGCQSQASPVESGLTAVWEVAVPATSEIWAGEGGAAVTRRRAEGEHTYPMVYINALGEKTGELDWEQVPRRFDILFPRFISLSDPMWLASDHDVEDVPVNGHTEPLILDSVWKIVDRNGKTVWETPLLVGASVFYCDEHVIGYHGKDPALLREIHRDEMPPLEYAALANERLRNTPKRVFIIDTKTGEILSSFEIPSSMSPRRIVNMDSAASGRALFAWGSKDGKREEVAFYDTDDGRRLQRIESLSSAIPERQLATPFPHPKGVTVPIEGGEVALLSFEGEVLWTTKVEGTTTGWPWITHVTEEGLLLVLYAERDGPTSFTSTSLTILDSAGKSLFYKDGFVLNNAVAVARSAPRAFALANGQAGESILYVFDLNGGKVMTTKRTLPEAVRYSVSPCGNYVLVLHKSTSQQARLVMYRVE